MALANKNATPAALCGLKNSIFIHIFFLYLLLTNQERGQGRGCLAKICKICSFPEFMVICVAPLMLLNLHLTNGMEPSSIQIRPVALHLDDEIAVASTSLCLPMCTRTPLPFCVFGCLSKHFSYILYIAFQYAFLICVCKLVSKGKRIALRACVCILSVCIQSQSELLTVVIRQEFPKNISLTFNSILVILHSYLILLWLFLLNYHPA